MFLAEVTRVSASTDVGESTAASTFFTFISYMLAPPIFGIVSYNLGYQSAFILVGGLAALSAAAMLGSIVKLIGNELNFYGVLNASRRLHQNRSSQ